MHVEIWSDVACPWCYVGKRRLEAALAGFEHRDQVTVTWRSFELDPSAPRTTGVDAATHLSQKYGIPREQAEAMQARVTAIAAEDGLEYRLDRQRIANTFDAHRLVHLGAAHGIQDAVKERLFRAHLGEGADLGDRDTLERLAVEAGLPADEAREVLLTEGFAEQVREDERTAAQLGIRGVPFFVVDRTFAASGAQPAEVLRDLLQRALPAEPAIPTVTGGDACGPEGC